MKKNGKYRFSLQFPAETEEQIQAGELLEKRGNRKGAGVVQALHEFLTAHQELLHAKGKIAVNTTQSFSKAQIEELVEKIVHERIVNLEMGTGNKPDNSDVEVDVSEMLDNVGAF